jgi:hypothetical protein
MMRLQYVNVHMNGVCNTLSSQKTELQRERVSGFIVSKREGREGEGEGEGSGSSRVCSMGTVDGFYSTKWNVGGNKGSVMRNQGHCERTTCGKEEKGLFGWNSIESCIGQLFHSV